MNAVSAASTANGERDYKKNSGQFNKFENKTPPWIRSVTANNVITSRCRCGPVPNMR